jgi:putative PIN family toxin of toxin-antitoxin system
LESDPIVLVIDTNIVLDLFVFDDAAARELKVALEARRLRWVATSAMRDELERVLGYPQIATRLAYYRLRTADVLAGFDRHAALVDVPLKAPVTCSDADDQKFIDLAVQHKCLLLSKDAAVLAMTKRLAPLDAVVAAVLPASAHGLMAS